MSLASIRRNLRRLEDQMGPRRSKSGGNRWTGLGWTDCNWQEKAAALGLQPQPKQQQAVSVQADITIFGGAAFGGKTWWLLYLALQHIANPRYGFVLFRRTTPQITNEGALWDESEQLYPKLGATPKIGRLEWNFPSGAQGRMAHMEHEKDRHAWDGAQIPFIGFDQLEHFTARQFFYMLSRNRTTIGVRPRICATCNPDPDSFLAQFLAWWIDAETGYPLPERSGTVRYFIRDGDEIVWGHSRGEIATAHPHLIAHDPDTEIKSITFIESYMEDNPIGLEADPGYVGNLNALPRVERERLKAGNWKIRPAAGLYFKREYFEVVDAVPSAGIEVRGWDLASSEADDAPYTVGVRLTFVDGIYYVRHVVRLRGSPRKVERALTTTASQDGEAVLIDLPQDPGQAGKAQVQHLVQLLAGYTVHSSTESGDKVERAGAFSAQAEAGNVKLVKGGWNEPYLDELEGFPESQYKDQVDASSRAFHRLTRRIHHRETVVLAGPATVPNPRRMRFDG